MNVSDIEITLPHEDGTFGEGEGCEDKHFSSVNIMNHVLNSQEE